MNQKKRIDGMKRYLLIFLIAAAAVSCARDLGNYTYTVPDAPVVSGIEDNIEVLTQEKLEISPVVTAGRPGDIYSYQWKAIDRNGDNEVFIIGEDRNLDYTVVLPPGDYSLYYVMTEKDTGIYWQTEVQLKVSTSMSEGWMVLCSDAGRARLDFISKVTGISYYDVLKDNKDMPVYTGPKKIHWQYDQMEFTDAPYYLFADNGATRLGKAAFEWTERYRMLYEMASMEDVVPELMVSAGFGKMIVCGTDAYYSENMVWNGLYGTPVNKDFRAAPYLGANAADAQQYGSVFLLYDMDNRRFMTYCHQLAAFGEKKMLVGMDELAEIADGIGEGQDTGASSVIGDAFKDYPEGYELVYMENTRYDPGNARSGVTYSILADGDRRYIYGIQLGDVLRRFDCKFVLGKACYCDISGCRDITSPDAMFTFSSLNNMMYYAVGNTVYRADLNAESPGGQVQFSLEGENITFIKFNLYKRNANRNRSYDLVVGSEKDGEGIIRIYEGFDSDGNFSGVTPEIYRGFAPVVDAAYKER